jgi:hypothetical protein
MGAARSFGHRAADRSAGTVTSARATAAVDGTTKGAAESGALRVVPGLGPARHGWGRGAQYIPIFSRRWTWRCQRSAKPLALRVVARPAAVAPGVTEDSSGFVPVNSHVLNRAPRS